MAPGPILKCRRPTSIQAGPPRRSSRLRTKTLLKVSEEAQVSAPPLHQSTSGQAPHTTKMPDTDTPQASTFRAPAFISHDPNLWFTILDVNFKAHKITSSFLQFSHACALLPSDVVSQVSETIASAPSSDTPYEDLKKAVLKRLESSVTARLQDLLSKEELGNEKPSDLLRRMKRLLGDKFQSFDQTLFTHLFYQRLPPAPQRNLFTVRDKLPLNDLAQLADDYMASTPAEPSTSITAVTASSDTQQLAQLITQLTLKVNSLEERLSDSLRQRPRSPSPRRFRQRPRSRNRTPGVCYYHEHFGDDAVKCTKPCSFSGQPLNWTGEC